MAKLTKTVTGSYEPSAASVGNYFTGVGAHLGYFRRYYIADMLRHPHVSLGLRIIKGRILSRARFFLDCQNEEVKNFLIDQVTRFWMFSGMRALTALEWGYSGAEALYTIRRGLYEFHMIKNFQAKDVRVITNADGEKIGISVINVPGRRGKLYIGGMKSLWHVQGREHHPWHGQSILAGAFVPWLESWKDGGARDIRNLYFYKYAFAGDSLYYPPGQAPNEDPTQNFITNRDIAREIVEKRRTGAVAVFPSTYDEAGNLEWRWEQASSGPSSAPILQYNDDLKTEILEGMGVPREVVEASETGSGYSGRRVPLEAFDSMLQDYVNWLIYDFDQQILQPLVRRNFGIEPDYEIHPFGLARGSVLEARMENGSTQEPLPAPGRNDLPMSLDKNDFKPATDHGIVYVK